MADLFIFGYGSLVNGATHEYTPVHPARLRGWRREWRYTLQRDVAFLSARSEPESSIPGVIMGVPRQAPALDAREYAYARTPVTALVDHPVKTPLEISIFAIPTDQGQQTNGNHSILLSYIDVVVQGYFRLYGAPGVQEFFETTDGWGAPVIDDRAAPLYPRHQPPDPEQAAFTDHWLARLSAVVKQL